MLAIRLEELLKEQEEQIKNRDESLEKAREEIKWLRGMLKEQNWIKCSDKMPEERDSIFAKLKGTDKWRSAMFEKSSDDVRIVEIFEDGTRRVYHSHTIDGKWDIEKQPIKRTVTHWMPNPELPKEGSVSRNEIN